MALYFTGFSINKYKIEIICTVKIISIALKTTLIKSLLPVEIYFLAENKYFIHLLLVNRKV